MSKELKITKEKVLEASKQCEQAKEVLKAMFPEAFEEEWKDVTMSLKFIPDSRQAFGFYWIGVYTEGATNHLAFIDGSGIHICEPCKNEYKVELSDDYYFRILERK